VKLKCFLIIIVISVFPTNTFAETIQNFNSQIIINKDRSIQVEENISYDFGENERRGIYRTIPLKGINIKGDIQTLHNSKPATQDISRGGDITIKIGDEDIYILQD